VFIFQWQEKYFENGYGWWIILETQSYREAKQ